MKTKTDPQIIDALKAAQELMRIARGRFPKSIRHRDKFALCLADAAVSKALASKRGGDRYLGWPEQLFVRINGLLPRIVDNALRKPLARVRHHANQTDH